MSQQTDRQGPKGGSSAGCLTLSTAGEGRRGSHPPGVQLTAARSCWLRQLAAPTRRVQLPVGATGPEAPEPEPSPSMPLAQAHPPPADAPPVVIVHSLALLQQPPGVITLSAAAWWWPGPRHPHPATHHPDQQDNQPAAVRP